MQNDEKKQKYINIYVYIPKSSICKKEEETEDRK